jgi:uncharacterized RDD family membrane protein YckC
MVYERGRDPTAVMGRRITAFVIDLLIISVIVSIFFRPDITQSDASLTVENGSALRCSQVVLESGERCIDSGGDLYIVDFNLFGALMLQLGLWLLNAVLIQGATGATAGKMLLGLRCVKANGEICGLGAAFIRSMLLLVDYALCFLIGLFAAMVSKGHQRLGDMAARTYVVRTSSLVSPDAPPRPLADPAPWSPPPPGPGSPPPWSPN